MRKSLFSLLLTAAVWAASVQAFAQTKILTMEDAFLNRALNPTNLRQLSWIEGTSEYAFLKSENNKDVLVSGSATSKKTKNILSLDELSKALESAGAEKLKGFPLIQWTSGNTFVVTAGGKFYRYNLKDKKATSLFGFDKSAQNPDVAPNKEKLAYTKDNNLYVSFKGKEDAAITNETNKGIVNGQAAHRSEFGITKGTFWSPNSNLLAFYRMDQSMVTDYPLVDISMFPAPAENNMIKYPMAGAKSHHVTIGVYNTASGKTTFLQTGEPAEQFLTNITFSPDEKHIYVAIVNRAQNHMKLNQYETASGKFVKTLFEEKADTYVEPENGLFFVPNNPNQFIWISERDGFDHLYLYDTNGKLIKQLTKGNWVVKEVMGFDKSGRNAYYLSTAESPLEIHLYSVNLSNGQSTKLTQGSGVHSTTLNSDATFFIDNYSSPVVPRQIRILDTNAKVKQTLLMAENPIKDYKLGEMTVFPLKADDGTDLYCRMIKPIDFDPNKKYPVVVYLYGGPHAQMITNNWLAGSNLWMQMMAQKGYVVFTMDSRGSANRGHKFESAVFRNFGTVEMKDQLVGVEYLKSQPFVDASRMGIHGWSFGGFMTTTIMLRSPETFKVGIGGGPVIDWRMYEIMYTERYMDTPEENPEGYEASNLLNYVKNLKGKLLLIHGTVDDVVVWQHSLAFLKKAVDEGVLLDYFVYPGHPHNVIGKDRVHLYKKITQYFDDHL